jgi:hypothetical protein
VPAFYTPPGDLSADQDEQYVPLEAVAQRLGISASILVRRVEAGDIPARRVQDGSAAHYELLLSDLGLEPEEVPPPPPPPAPELQRVAPYASPLPSQSPPPAPPMPMPASVPLPVPVSLAPHFVAAPPAGEVAGNGRSVATLAEVSTAPIDPRELVSGLLDRWERTLEHRIYAEQQQRFESELAGRQALLKELQMELQTARAEHAAAQADKDRALAERDRAIADRDRELDSLREAVADQKRGRFFRR